MGPYVLHIGPMLVAMGLLGFRSHFLNPPCVLVILSPCSHFQIKDIAI